MSKRSSANPLPTILACAAAGIGIFGACRTIGAAAAPVAAYARGEYLTHGAGQCSDCHGTSLHGGPIPPGPPGVAWAKTAPSLAGLAMFANDEAAIAFLATAKRTGGSYAEAPMPRYRFDRDDATAIVMYLRHLK